MSAQPTEQNRSQTQTVEKSKFNQIRGKPVYVDLIRTVAMIAVPLLHAAGRWTITPTELQQLTPPNFATWAIVDIYQSFAVMGVPLFLMLTGALLLQPQKTDSLIGFFKKRWDRIGLPTLFWGSAYFAWDFLVVGIPFGVETIVQGILNGPYTQFWYLYVLVGLYLFTPILRVFMAHAEQAVIKYFILLWILGVSILPVFSLITSFQLTDNIITVTGYVGYMVIGSYLSTTRMHRKPLILGLVAGMALTAIGTYALAATGIGKDMYFFQQYFSPTVLISAVSLFLLLLTVAPPTQAQENKPSALQRLIKLISINTLGIFLVHVMINEAFQMGLFGFTISRDVLNPIIEIPLLATIVLFMSLAIIATVKKVPYINKIIA